MVCHWPGIYFNGEKVGFNILKETKHRLDQKYDNLIWMKLSEISRYWAAKELTKITVTKDGIKLFAPFTAADFTLRIDKKPGRNISLNENNLQRVPTNKELKSGTFFSSNLETVLCFDLIKGENRISI
jgi:hypothetical protein